MANQIEPIVLPQWIFNSVINHYIHTYIIGHYNPSVRIMDLVSPTTYVACVNFIHHWRDLQFKVDSERQIFWETSHGSFYLLSKFLPEICWEEIAKEILFVFRFWCLAWDSNPGFWFNKPTHYLLDHGDFKIVLDYTWKYY